MASEIKVDTVSEKTSGSGVTIDGLLIKDGGISGDVSLIGTTPTFTIGDAGAEDAALVFDGNAQDFYIGLDDSADDLIIGHGSTVGSSPAISIDESQNVTIADGSIDFNIASHDTSNGLKLGGTLVSATAAELNILDGVTATAAEINLIDGGTARGTTAIADGDGVLINDAGTMRQTTVETLKTYIGGFDVSSITGATALTTQPASTDELVLSDNGTLKRLDFAHLFATPAFEATVGSTYNISDATAAKVSFNTEVFDTDGKYDHSSNYRFTPTVAGKYFCYLYVQQSGEANGNFEQGYAYIYKNGSSHAQIHTSAYSSNALRDITFNVYAVIDLDADDYIEAYAFYDDNDMGSNPRMVGGATNTRFGAYRLLI